jgi:hypothetical protein
VLLPPAEPAPTQIDQTEEVVDEVKKWEIWWELFFGH